MDIDTDITSLDVGGDTPPACPPRPAMRYNLKMATATTVYRNIVGVQLQRQGSKCGWIRIYDAGEITRLLGEGQRVGCIIISVEEFTWNLLLGKGSLVRLEGEAWVSCG